MTTRHFLRAMMVLAGPGLVLAGCVHPGDWFRDPPERVLRWMARDPRDGDRLDAGMKELTAMGSRAVEPVLKFYKAHGGVDHLADWPRDPLFWLAREVVECIARVREREALPRLVELARDTDETLALCALHAVRSIAVREDVGDIVCWIEDDRFRWKEWLIQLLGKLGGEGARRALLRYVQDGRYAFRLGAYYGLKTLGDRSVVPKLREALNNERDPHLRIAAAETLASLGDEAGAAHLAALLEGDSPDYLLITAAYASGRAREKKAVPGLIKLLSHKEWYFRNVAREALTMIGTDEALKGIEHHLTGDQREMFLSSECEYFYSYDRDPFMDWQWEYED